MAKASRVQKKEARARKEKEQAQKVFRWLIIGLATLAVAAIVWASMM